MSALDITTQRTVWCGRCSWWNQEGAHSKSQFERRMRKAGWRIRHGKTVCPECAAELKVGSTWEAIGYRKDG